MLGNSLYGLLMYLSTGLTWLAECGQMVLNYLADLLNLGRRKLIESFVSFVRIIYIAGTTMYCTRYSFTQSASEIHLLAKILSPQPDPVQHNNLENVACFYISR